MITTAGTERVAHDSNNATEHFEAELKQAANVFTLFTLIGDATRPSVPPASGFSTPVSELVRASRTNRAARIGCRLGPPPDDIQSRKGRQRK